MRLSISHRKSGFIDVMDYRAADILKILDDAAQNFIFPMLDNGYVYLAAARLSLFRSAQDWGLVFETFGFSPRAGLPDLAVTTFSSHLVGDKANATAVKPDLREYAKQIFYHPIENGDWIDPEDSEMVKAGATSLSLRGQLVSLPSAHDYADAQVECENASQPFVFELCRALANMRRDAVLATIAERTASLSPELKCILTLEDWHHPDVVCSEDLPSKSQTFRQLADVLINGDTSVYQPSKPLNAHWSNWPDGGSL
jgi:hypothetical protein